MESFNFSEASAHTSFVTLRDYLRVLFRQKAVVLTAIFTVLITVFISLTLKTPVYEAQVKMLISAAKLVQAPYSRDIPGNRNDQEALTQSEIAKSAPVLERAVRALGLKQKPEDYEKRYASPIKCKLIDFMLRLKKTQGVRYTPKQQQLLAFRGAVEDLRKRIKVEPIRATNLFTISVQDFDPIGAAAIVNVVSRSYVIFDQEQQLADLALKYGDKHPTIIQLKDNIDKMAKRLRGNPLSNIEAIGPATVKIIEQARVPLQPTGPRKLIVMALGLFMSIFLGLMLAFVFEYMDPTFKSPREVEAELALPFLGSIPRQGFMAKLTAKKKSAYAHYYQMLADELYLLVKDRKVKTILVTSSSTKEGISAVVANLGALLSQKAGHRVLLVDANLRHPGLHKLLKIENTAGWAEVIEGKAALKDVIHDQGQNLHMITAGTTGLNPVILLDSGKVKELLEEVRKEYEVVLMDCSDLTGFKDALVLSAHTDATVVVVSEGFTRRQILKITLRPLVERKVNILGVVLNNRTFPIPKFIYERV
ncbi:polysaccharide biosynthesis tyrosine autokinase [bacterium]|nr:polysaccharide biosynthesis tyrosine autokinase [bacterium]